MRSIVLAAAIAAVALPAFAQNAPFIPTARDWGGHNYQFRSSNDRLNDAQIAVIVELTSEGAYRGARPFHQNVFIDHDEHVKNKTVNNSQATSIGNQVVVTNNCSNGSGVLNCGASPDQENKGSAQTANATDVQMKVYDDFEGDIIDNDVDIKNGKGKGGKGNGGPY